MTIPFDHVQIALDANMIAGNQATTIDLPPGPYTDEEVWRSWINAGFTGEFDFIEATLRFKAYAQNGDNSVSATWKWQIRPDGQSTWTDLHSDVPDTFSANIERVKHVVFDSIATTAEDVPFELRLVFTTTDTDDDITFVLSSLAASASTLRAVGTSS